MHLKRLLFEEKARRIDFLKHRNYERFAAMEKFCCAEEIEGRKNMRKINITTGFINDKSAFCKRRRYAPASNDSLCCHETLKEQLYSTFNKRTESNDKK